MFRSAFQGDLQQAVTNERRKVRELEMSRKAPSAATAGASTGKNWWAKKMDIYTTINHGKLTIKQFEINYIEAYMTAKKFYLETYIYHI